MSKRVTLSEEAYKLLAANREHPKETLSSVIIRFVPRRITAFGVQEKYLDQADAQLRVDFEALEQMRERKRKGNHVH
jgi:predicted CopG family antitoxin